jgi:hypothetical protein
MARVPARRAAQWRHEYPVIRLQVRRFPLKPGKAPRRWYDQTPLAEVLTLDLDDDGACSLLSALSRSMMSRYRD